MIKDFETMTVNGAELADMFDLTAMRINQLVADGVIKKPEKRGQYKLKDAVRAYVNEIRRVKKVTGLTAKQEENLEIKNQRERVEVLREYGTLVQRDAVIQELVPIIKALQSGLRALPNNTARENMNICKEYAAALKDGNASDQNIATEFRDRDLKIVDDLLQTLSDTISEKFGMKNE